MQSVDALVVGGGVNGVAVLRELALNNVSAVLVEQGDFCAGASGVSTRMAHGGLRYLENREFSLVAESAKERNLLLKNAPHLTAPLQIILPLEALAKDFFGSALNFLGIGKRRVRSNFLSIKLALSIYEFFGRVHRSLPRHSVNVGRSKLPMGLASRFRAHATYFDGRFCNPEGLVFEMLEEAVTGSDAFAALNYVGWAAMPDGSITITDTVTGEVFTVRPQIVINASGAWLDQVNGNLGVATDFVTAVKGTHIVVRNERLLERLKGRAFYFDDGSGRMVICCPLEKTVLMGTTEIAESDPSKLTVEEDEIDYLLTALSGLFDDIPIERGDIISAITGARPLKKAVGDDIYSANRGHAIHCTTPEHKHFKILSMVGGKWTTFRLFAEQAVDRVLLELERTRLVSTEDRTYRGTLPGSSRSLLDGMDDQSKRLIDRYGNVGFDVAEHCALADDANLASLPTYTEREISWLVLNRGALYLDDVVLRRTQIALDGLASDDVLQEIADILGRVLGRSQLWISNEVARCKQLLAIRMPINRPSPHDKTFTQSAASVASSLTRNLVTYANIT